MLRRGGRLVLNVWQGLDRHPFYETLHDAIQRRLGTSALDSIFALDDPSVLRTLLTDAGFQRVQIDPVSMTSRFPHPDVFLAAEIELDTAAIPSMQNLTPAQRQAMVAAISEDMKGPLHDRIQDDHVVLQFHANVVRAWR